MLKQSVLDALNKQIQHEFSNSYAYLAVAAYFEDQVYSGFAAYFRKQAKEEHEHGMKIYEHVLDLSAKPTLAAIEAPKADFAAPLDALKFVHALERKTTSLINALYELAAKENDLPTRGLMEWFVKEQVEEEKWSDEFVTTGERVGTHTGAWYMFDHHVSKKAKGE
jgi:ferritin